MTKKFSYKVHGFAILGAIILLLGFYWQLYVPGNCHIRKQFDCLPASINPTFKQEAIIFLAPYKTHIYVSLYTIAAMCFLAVVIALVCKYRKVGLEEA